MAKKVIKNSDQANNKIQEKKKLFTWKRLAAAILVLGIGGFLTWKFAIQKKNNVATATIEKGTVKEELILTGEIKADEYVALRFPTSGKIAWIGVSEGDKVSKGQALAKLDTTGLNSTYQRAQADLRDADATVTRVHDDLKDKASTETFTETETRVSAEVAKDKAWEAVIAAEENLRNANLVAPFAGIVSSLASTNPGVNILATETAVEVVNPETIYFEVTADQNEVNDLHIGQEVTVILDSFSEEEVPGTVSFISYTPLAGEAGAVYKVKVSLASSADATKFRIGMTGDAKFLIAEKSDVLFAPADFVHSDTTGSYINKAKKNNKVYIDTGIEGEERIEITSDKVNEGDIIFD